MDLGVSSLQLDRDERGFSYSRDAPLDMRMDRARGRTAADVLAGEPAGELERMLREYGEERFAARIASGIVRARERAPVVRTGQLARIVRESIPAPARRSGGNPCKRTFQALRIAVNDELAVLERAVPRAVEAIAVGGRIAVESYHSLEDRIVKREFAKGAASSSPAGLPVELEGHEPYLRLLTRGAVKATAQEAAANPRSASVRLRAAEKLRTITHNTTTS
jgi:S-adenosyl-methyltransferase mraW